MENKIKNKQIKAYLTSEEYKTVSENAKQAKLSISTYIRKISLGYEIKSQVDNEAVNALLKANADLGRLGGLLKNNLKNFINNEQIIEFKVLLNSIEESKKNVEKNVLILANKLMEK